MDILIFTRCYSLKPMHTEDVERQILGVQISTLFIYIYHSHCKRPHAALRIHDSPCTPKALSLGAERQIFGVKISARVIQLWHAHCKRTDAAFKIHNALI